MKRLSEHLPFQCEIVADRLTAPALAAIAHSCAWDLSVSLVVDRHEIGTREFSLTLRVPALRAFESNNVWRLAGRIACLCPQVRVAVLVESPPVAADEVVAEIECSDAA